MFNCSLIQTIACDNIAINCTRGSQCKVDEDVHQAYCEPSCNLDNGGCADNEVCSLQQQRTCTSGPCPPLVHCLSELLTSNANRCDVDNNNFISKYLKIKMFITFHTSE